MSKIAALLLAALVAGCMSTTPRQAERYFILAPAAVAADAGRPASSVRIAPMSASSFYDTQDIAYSASPGTRAYYHYNRWTERPQLAIHAALASRLGPGSPQNALLLRTHLDEIYHDAAATPGAARIVLTAQLVDADSRTVVARRTFAASAPAASHDAAGAVQGFGRALTELIGNLATWVDAEARVARLR